MHGYHGHYLRINLTTQTVERRPIAEQHLRQWLGGVGLGTWLLRQETPPRLDPFDPRAALVLAFSPLVGTPLTTSAKFAVVSKSPLTERLNDALSSSHFAMAGKRAAGDALVIVGSCVESSILVIDDGRMHLEPAGDLGGLCVPDATQRLRDRLGADFRVGVIGPAGESGVRYATLSFDGRHAGRGGSGAVLGAKRLKAIAVRGEQRVTLADAAAVVAQARDLSRRSFGPATAKYRELGTVSNLLTFNRLHALPTRNFQSGQFTEAEAISGESLNEARLLTRSGCAACTIGCEHIYRAADGQGVRLEYESLFALGPLCGIGDREAILSAARLCDDFGLDTISTGATIAFAMECAQRGWLPEPALRFGRSDALQKAIEQIARREGIGRLLGEGSRRAAEVIGHEAPQLAPHVKGLEIPGYEPRTLQTMALGFAVGSRGADHNRSGAYEADFSTQTDRLNGSPASAALAVQTENRAALIDSLILCKFLRGVFADLYAESAELLRAVTGWDIEAPELRLIAERIVTLKKHYNIREGWTRAEDTLPERFLSQGLPTGEATAAHLPRERLDAMIESYYQTRGWASDGTIPPEQLRACGIE